MRLLSVRLDDRSDNLLTAYCARTGQSRTEAVKAAIAALADQPGASPAQLAQSFDLIGAFDSGKTDLGRGHSRHLKAKLRRARA